MVVFWKVILTILILYTIAIDGNRARRRRRQAPMLNPNPAMNPMNQPPLGPNPQILNAPGQLPSPQGAQNDYGMGKQGGGGRQYYPYQGQYGYGSMQGLNYPYAGSGLGAYQYGGLGQSGAYYNQYPGSSSFYGSSYNRPGYGGGGYGGYGGYGGGGYGGGGYGGYGGGGYGGGGYGGGGIGGYGGYGGYFWNAGQKQNINMFTVFLSSLLTLVICLITV